MLNRILTVVLTCTLLTGAFGQTLIPNIPRINGYVYDMALDTPNNKLYLAGTLSHGGDFGQFAALTDTSGTLFSSFPVTNGLVNTVVSDGNGGWYLGGAFTQIGNTLSKNIAHVLPNHTVNTNFWETNGEVRTIARMGNRLFLGGSFSSIQRRETMISKFVMVNRSTMKPDFSFPRVNGDVFCILADSSGGFYIGGYFSKVADSTRTNIAYIDHTGQVTAWKPSVLGDVKTMSILADKLLIAGSFTAVNGVSRSNIAAVSIYDGSTQSWNPSTLGRVNAIAARNDTVFVGGNFSNIGGAFRDNFALLNATSGTAYPFVANTTGEVLSLSLRDTLLALGGAFGQIGAPSRLAVGVFNTKTMTLTPASYNINGIVNNLELSDRGLYIGGYFTSINGFTRNYLASLNPVSTNLNNWIPDAKEAVTRIKLCGNALIASDNYNSLSQDNISTNGTLTAYDTSTAAKMDIGVAIEDPVYALAISNSKIAIGGTFKAAGFANRLNVAAINTLNGDTSSWKPAIGGMVYKIYPDSEAIFIGGKFTTVNGSARTNVASVDTNGLLQSFNPVLAGGEAVRDIVTSRGSVFLGGFFSTFNGQFRYNLAKLNKSTGTMTASFNANCPALGYVYSMLLHDSVLYVGGSFTSMGGQSRTNFACLDTNTGSAKLWFNHNVNNVVYGLCKVSNNLCVVGNFTTINAQTRNRTAMVSLAGTQLLPWHIPSSSNELRAVATDMSNQRVLIGGASTTIGNSNLGGLACLDLNTMTFTNWRPLVTAGDVNKITLKNNRIFVAGSSNMAINGVTRPYLACIDATTGILDPTWNPVFSGDVNTIGAIGNKLFVYGVFSSVNSTSRFRLAALDLQTGSLTSWNPGGSSVSSVTGFLQVGSNVLITGSFSNIGGQSREGMVMLDTSAGAVITSFNANLSSGSIPNKPMLQNNLLYFTGQPFSISGQLRNGFAAVHATTGALQPFNLNNITFSGLPKSLQFYQNLILVTGNFTYVNGQHNRSMVIIDTLAQTKVRWVSQISVPTNDYNITATPVYQNRIWIGGLFNNIDGFSQYYYAGFNLQNIPLSVKYTGFKGWCLNGERQIQFTTTAEKNINRFELLNGMSEEALHLKAVFRPQQGNLNEYRYSDQKNGDEYYQVKTVTQDGKEILSPVIKVSTCDPNSLRNPVVYPNPTNGKIFIEGNHTILKVTVYNSSGMKVRETSSLSEIDLSGMPKSLYLLHIETNEGLITKKVILQ